MIKRARYLKDRFDKDGFMKYLAETFHGFENSFLRETIEKIIETAHFSTFEQSNNWIAYYIKEHIADEVQLTEIMKFVKND